MSVPADAVQEIWREQIRPVYFSRTDSAGPPVFILLTGQPGSGTSQATGMLLAEHPEMTVLNADDLRAFHPRALNPTAMDVTEDADEVEATSAWLREGMRYARENHRSLLLEGSFADPAAAAATVTRYAAEGFQTRLVVLASSRAESLMTVTSRYLRDVQAGLPARLINRDVHDAGLAGTRAVLTAFDTADAVDRITVLDRHGRMLFDGTPRTRTPGHGGAAAVWEAAVSAPLGRFDATQWLSELGQISRYASTRRDIPMEVTELLVDLHQVSLREVIPNLQVPAGSAFAATLDRETVARLVALRRALPTGPQVDAAAPVVSPGRPERGGVSR